MAFVALQDLPAAQLNAAVGASWTNYTPSWTTLSSPQPSLGNGTINGRWTKIGSTVFVRIGLLMGSTTTFGTAAYQFSLPETSATVTGFSGFPIWLGNAYALDSGTANQLGVARIQSASTIMDITGNNTGGQFQSTIPFTWAVNDFLAISIAYEGQAF